MRIESVRPIVRYVDESQAIVDAAVVTRDADEAAGTLLVSIDTTEGFHDECAVAAEAATKVRISLVEPERWWPACMGPQPLYELSVRLIVGPTCVDSRTVTLGLASIRAGGTELLVNGRVCAIHHVVHVDRVHERRLLPAAGNSLLLVRDHYGDDTLYQAADRAGILLVQCVPIHVEAAPEDEIAGQVDRLAAHPSLAGWFVGHLGRLADAVAARIERADPTRPVLRRWPLAG